MGQGGKARRREAIRERKAATRARLSVPPTPPRVPVTLPWRRRATGGALRRQARAEGAAWSMVLGAEGMTPVVSGDAGDLEGSLAAAVTMVNALGPFLARRRS